MIDCADCRLPVLCARCCDDRFAQLRGVAACRGTVAARGPGATEADAAAAVADIARDPELRRRLAIVWLEWTIKPPAPREEGSWP